MAFTAYLASLLLCALALDRAVCLTTPPVAAVALRSLSRRAALFMQDKGPETLRLVDMDGDEIAFLLEQGALKLVVGDEVIIESVQTLGFDPKDGTVQQDNGEGSFVMRPEDRETLLPKLQALAEAAGIPYEELEDADADEEADERAAQEAARISEAADVELPAEVEALLINDELKAQRPGVKILWARLCDVYPSEADALAAVQRNSAIVLPYLNRPVNIDGSWMVLKSMMSESEALEVITSNPGILACNPVGLKSSTAADVKRAARVVDVVEAMPMAARWGVPAALTAGVVGILVSNAENLGF